MRFGLAQTSGFCAGVALGALLAAWVAGPAPSGRAPSSRPSSGASQYEKWFSEAEGLRRRRASAERARYGGRFWSEADALRARVKVACFAQTRSGRSGERRAEAAAATWAAECDGAHEYGGAERSRAYASSFHALCEAIGRAARERVDWALFVRDDAFVVPGNLRRAVAALDPRLPHYVGHAESFWGVEYNSADAGFALNSVALRALSRRFPDDEACRAGGKYWKREDFYLGKHLRQLGVSPVDTRDEYGNSIFLAHDLDKTMFPNSIHKFSKFFTRALYPVKCCSYRTITFQVLSYTEIYKYYYMVYVMRIFLEGDIGNRPAPTLEPDESVWQKFVSERGLFLNLSAKEYEKSWYMKFANATVFPEFNKFGMGPMKDFNLTNMPQLLADMLTNFSSYKL